MIDIEGYDGGTDFLNVRNQRLIEISPSLQTLIQKRIEVAMGVTDFKNYIPADAQWLYLRSSDLDNDGVEEKVITYQQNGESKALILERGKDSWKKYFFTDPSPDLILGESDVRELVIGDINSDGKKEVVAGFLGGTHGYTTVIVQFDGKRVINLLCVESYYVPENGSTLKECKSRWYT